LGGGGAGGSVGGCGCVVRRGKRNPGEGGDGTGELPANQSGNTGEAKKGRGRRRRPETGQGAHEKPHVPVGGGRDCWCRVWGRQRQGSRVLKKIVGGHDRGGASKRRKGGGAQRWGGGVGCVSVRECAVWEVGGVWGVGGWGVGGGGGQA